MKSPMKFFPIVRPFAAILSLALFCACQKEMDTFETYTIADLDPELQKNNLLQLPGAVHRYATDSPIHWQPWTRETLDHAKESGRMIFAVVTTVQAPGFAEVLDTLAGDRHSIETINSTYLPVVIDADAAREIGILTANLAAEINHPLNLPFFIWMSPDANPVAWIPAGWVDAETTRDQFRRSHTLVSKIWEESPGYVVQNSEMDQQARQQRMARRKLQNLESENPALDTIRSIRQLTSLYDPLSRNYDEIGGLFPSGALDLLAAASMQPGLPADVRRRSDETTRDYIKDLLGSAMFDPLDGGLFSARRGSSWTLPTFHRNSITQARASMAMFRAYQATNDPLALERALGVLQFAEQNYRTSDGLFAIGYNPTSLPIDWMWTVEQIEKILGPEDGPWWVNLTSMEGLGNIPYEIDPERRYFRHNTISLRNTLEQLAAAEGSTAEAFRSRFHAAREKLLAARWKAIGDTPHDENPHATASFRMVSAYASAFTATGDETWRNKAADLLSRSREAFSHGARLHTFTGESPATISDARAFTYAIAIHALLDVVDITGNESWLDWCDDLATVMIENFIDSDLLLEASQDANVIDLPITDYTMLFEESSLGLINLAEARLAAKGRPLVRQLRQLAGSLPIGAVDFPVQYTDITLSFLTRQYPVTIVYNSETSDELMEHISRLPTRMFHRRTASADQEPPPGACLVIRGTDTPVTVTNSADLANAALPNP